MSKQVRLTQPQMDSAIQQAIYSAGNALVGGGNKDDAIAAAVAVMEAAKAAAAALWDEEPDANPGVSQS